MTKAAKAVARARPRVQFHCVGESRTLQSEASACDINQIMRRFEKTGVLTHTREFGGRYGDFVDAPGFHQACTLVVEAEQMFASLPSKVRKHFRNDPAEFLAAVEDPEREGELRALGLLQTAEPAAPAEAAAAAPPGTAGEPETSPEGSDGVSS